MSKRVHFHPSLIYSAGTQVVTLKDVPGSQGRILHPRGAVGVVVRPPGDGESGYRIRFLDGVEAALDSREIMLLAKFKEGQLGDIAVTSKQCDLYQRVIYRCVTVYLSSGRLTVTIHDHTYLQIAWRTAVFALPMDCDHDHLDVPYWGVGTDWGTGGNYCLPSPDATCTINRVIQ